MRRRSLTIRHWFSMKHSITHFQFLRLPSNMLSCHFMLGSTCLIAILAFTKTRNNETKRSERNHRNVGFVSVVSLVSFRLFRFVVSGFSTLSTCQFLSWFHFSAPISFPEPTFGQHSVSRAVGADDGADQKVL